MAATAAPATAPAHRPENRGLKLTGLLLAIAGFGALGLVAESLREQWQHGVAALAPWLAAAVLAGNLLAAGLIVLAIGCGSARGLSDPRRRRAVALQVLLANALVPVLLFGMLADDPALMDRFGGEGLDIALTLLAYGLCFFAWRLWRRSRRTEAISADEAMALDPRAPVLYLRSFRDDGLSLLAQHGSTMKRRAMSLLRLPTPEEQMARILARLGPLIAIGKPGEPLPELGAARLYVAHDQWQQTVAELMRRAALVVVRVGASPGVLWEIEQALERLPRQRLVLAVLGGDPVAPELVQRLAPVLGSSLDGVSAQSVEMGWRTALLGAPALRIGGLVCFDRDGKASVVRVQQPATRLVGLGIFKRLLRPMAGPLQDAWKEVFVRTRLGWGELRPQRSRMVAVALALLLGFVGAHWFYLGHTRRGFLYLVLLPVAMASLFLGIIDALRFVWIDRAEFDSRIAPPRRAAASTPGA